MSDRSVELGAGWTLWRGFCVRSAGFEADRIHRISIPDIELDPDAYAEAKKARQKVTERALSAMQTAFKAVANDDRDAKKAFKALRRALREDLPLDGLEVPAPELEGPLTEVKRARAAVEDMERPYTDALTAVQQHLRDTASDPKFREALAWQNRRGLEGTVDSLTRRPVGATDSKTRECERVVSTYLQRYCMKNESIGFFGPIIWGGFVDEGERLTLQPGPDFLTERRVYFEYWCISAVADALSADPEILPWVPPALPVSARMEGNEVRYSAERSVTVSDAQAALLRRCDGVRTGRQVVEEALSETGGSFEEGLAALFELNKQGFISWNIEVPSELPHPDRELRRILQSIGDDAVRNRALGTLDGIVEKRDDLARAAGDAESVVQALEALETHFEEITGRAATRRHGETYASRQIVYEDCLRGVDVRLGPQVRDALAGPMSIILESARWFCAQVAKGYRDTIQRAYQVLRKEVGSDVIELAPLLKRVAKEFAPNQYKAADIVHHAVQALQDRWSEVLNLDSIDRKAPRIQYESEKLLPAVNRFFKADSPGWPGARFHSPDIMIAGSRTGINEDDYLIVLGELHPGLNSPVCIPPMLHQSPDPGRVLAWMEEDYGVRRIAPVVGKDSVDRAAFRSLAPGDFAVRLDETASWRPPEQVFAVRDLVVDGSGDRLVIRTADGRHAFDPVAFFEYYLVVATAGHFSVVPTDWPHVPRITIDRMVVSRERWSLKANQVPLDAAIKKGDNPVVAADAWRKSLGLPQRVFFKVKEEPKPMYLDFRSPNLVELFAKMVKKTRGRVAVSELLPDHDGLWLEDAEGRTYTAELRLAALDPKPWDPAA